MAFYHGPRVIELYAGGAPLPVPSWPDTQAPTILTPPTGAVDENHSYAIILAATEPVTFSILPGADSVDFTLDGETLTLPAQDYEAGKIIFTCNLRATDAAGNVTDFAHRVFIDDINGGSTPLRRLGAVTATKDGSTGQVYTAPAGMTDRQWYREALTVDRTTVAIEGETGATYVSQASDEGHRLVARGIIADILTDAVALNVVLPVPILIESFDSTTGFTLSAGAAVSIDVADKVQGSGSMIMAGTGTASAKAVKTVSANFDPNAVGAIAYMVDLGQDAESQSIQNGRVVLVRGATEYYQANVTTINGATYQTPSTLWLGKTWSSFDPTEVTAMAGIGAGDTGVALTHSGVVPYTASPKYDALMGKAGGRPTVIITHDDAYLTEFTVARPLLEARGLLASFYVPLDNVGADPALRMDLPQLQALYAAGHDICPNGTKNDGPMTGKASIAAALQEVADAEAWLIANGMPRGVGHLCYPNGIYQVPGAKIVPTAVTTNGTTAAATMTSTTGIVAGMEVRGFNVPAGTTVVSNDSATQVTLSQIIPAQTKPMSFTDTSGAFHTGKLPKALLAAGYKSARTTLGSGGQHTRFGPGTRNMVMFGNSMHALTSANFIAAVELAKRRGQTYMTYTHGVQPGGGIHIDEAKYTANLDYLAAQRDAGLIDVLTLSQWWARDGGSSVPV